MVRQVPFPNPLPKILREQQSDPAGTVGTSFPLTPLGRPQTFHNAFDTSKDSRCGFLRRRLLA